MQASITWKQCAELPTKYSSVKIAVINGKVYCGGWTDDDDEYIICCYDPQLDNWTTLPPLPVRWFGLGQVSGKLVAVGGEKKDSDRRSDMVYTYDEQSRRWTQTIPPMPTARYAPGVLSLQKALVVAGGIASYEVDTNTVEIFKPDTSQWYNTNPLPTPCCSILLSSFGRTCYAIGGYQFPASLTQALYASVDDLLHNAVPSNQTTHSGSNVTQSAWKILPNTPTYTPAVAVLAGNLLAVGGTDTSDFIICSDRKEVYMYSPSANSWIYFSDLPEPRSRAGVAVLSSTEILVIGGWCNFSTGRVNTVYKGTLSLGM